MAPALTEDHPPHSKLAQAELAGAEVAPLALPAPCELVWVLSRGYKMRSTAVAEAILRLVNNPNVVVNRSAVKAGRAMLSAGRDFADGVIAYGGRWLGTGRFVSFGRKAVKLVEGQGEAARLPT